TASDPDGDHVALSASSLPSGATFSDHGDDTGSLSWTPGSTQSGTYVVAFLGNDGHGGTGTASTSVMGMEVSGGGGGGGEVPGRACLLGKFKPHKDRTCFRIRPVDHSFDLRDVDLSSLRLRFHGQSIAALDSARIELCCRHGHGHGDDGDDDDQGDDDHGDGDHHDAVGAIHVDADARGEVRTHDGDDRHDECGVSCEDHGHCHHGDDQGDDHGHGDDRGHGDGDDDGHGHDCGHDCGK